MGYFKDLEIDVIDMFHSEGMKETEIAASTGLPLSQVHNILDAYDRVDMDCDDEVVSYDELTFEPTELGDVDYA